MWRSIPLLQADSENIYFKKVIEKESKKGSAKKVMLTEMTSSNYNSSWVFFCLWYLQLRRKIYLELSRNVIMLSPSKSQGTDGFFTHVQVQRKRKCHVMRENAPLLFVVYLLNTKEAFFHVIFQMKVTQIKKWVLSMKRNVSSKKR